MYSPKKARLELRARIRGTEPQRVFPGFAVFRILRKIAASSNGAFKRRQRLRLQKAEPPSSENIQNRKAGWNYGLEKEKRREEPDATC
jgi:hypothetical protein